MLDAGADANASRTTQYAGKETPLSVAVKREKYNKADLLLNRGANVPDQAEGSFTVLHLAARQNQPLIAERLLEVGAQTDAKLKNSSQPVHPATSSDETACLKLLLDRENIDVNVTNTSDRTPLRWAAEDGHWPTVEVLLDRGADNSFKADVRALDLAEVEGRRSGGMCSSPHWAA